MLRVNLILRKFILSVFPIVALLIPFSVFAEAQREALQIEHWSTPKGASVYFVRTTNLPMLYLRVIFSAGSTYDQKKQGVALLTGSMLEEGAQNQSADDIAQAFDNVGADFNVSVDRDKATVALRSLTDQQYLGPALSEYTLVLTKPTFSLKSFKRVKNQVYSAIKVNQQHPGQIAEDVFYQELYGEQPYAHNPLGSIETVNNISQRDCEEFFHRFYVAKNANIILVGNLDLQQAKKVALKISNAMPAGTAAPILKPEHSAGHKGKRHVRFPTKQTSVVIGQLGITRKNPDFFPLIVGNYAFGGLPLGSILFLKVRDQQGLAYYAGSNFNLLRYRGPFMLVLKTRAGKTREALSITKNSLEDLLKEGLSEQQLYAAKQNLIGSFPLAFSSNSGIAKVVSNIAFYHRPLNYLDTYISKVSAVTLDQIKDAFNKLINLNRLVVVTVGPQQPAS